MQYPTRKVLTWIGAGLVAVMAGFAAYSYWRPPLAWEGGVTGLNGKTDDRYNVGWDLRNSGWFAVRITAVEIDHPASAVPVWVTGAVNPGGQMVGSAMPETAETDGYLRVPLGQFVIPPRTPYYAIAVQEGHRVFRAPTLYGLVIRYHLAAGGPTPVASRFVIHYRYMGLPMKLVRHLE